MDPRLRGAIDASVGWYEDLCALHGVGSMLADGLWSALDKPPPLHSDAVAVEPEVTAGQVAARLDGRDRCGVKDSFAAMDLAAEGMEPLFAATWIHREAAPVRRPAPPAGWAVVTGAGELAEWTGKHDTRDVLLPPLLRRAHFRILARYADGGIVAGAVARLGSGVVDVSNVYAVPGHGVDWAELAEVVGAFFPGRPLVGYEHGKALASPYGVVRARHLDLPARCPVHLRRRLPDRPGAHVRVGRLRRGRARLPRPRRGAGAAPVDGRAVGALAVLDSVCTDWRPRMPVRLYYSPGDEEAVNANTVHCHAALAGHGVPAPTVDLGVDTAYNGFVHEGSEVLGVPAVTRWFTGLS